MEQGMAAWVMDRVSGVLEEERSRGSVLRYRCWPGRKRDTQL